MVTRMREKGQVTIPASIRESLHLSKDSILSVVKAGSGVLLMPKPSVVDSFGAKLSKEAKEKGITLDDLLKELRKIRHNKPRR